MRNIAKLTSVGRVHLCRLQTLVVRRCSWRPGVWRVFIAIACSSSSSLRHKAVDLYWSGHMAMWRRSLDWLRLMRVTLRSCCADGRKCSLLIGLLVRNCFVRRHLIAGGTLAVKLDRAAIVLRQSWWRCMQLVGGLILRGHGKIDWLDICYASCPCAGETTHTLNLRSKVMAKSLTHGVDRIMLTSLTQNYWKSTQAVTDLTSCYIW